MESGSDAVGSPPGVDGHTPGVTTPTGVLVVDKPSGPTSHDVVQATRRRLKTRRVGHAGTLDPMATGVLIIAVGEATKLVPYLTAEDKNYEATVRLGQATDSLDAQGAIVAEAEVPPLSGASIKAAVGSFLGAHEQRAPKVSAIKIGGKRLHQRVRDGEEFTAPTRSVQLHDFVLLGHEPTAIRFRISVSKGFYVRSFARDLAEALGTVGHLGALRRLASGRFEIGEASEDRFISMVAAARRVLPTIEVPHETARDIAHGRKIPAERLGRTEELLAALFDGSLIAILARDGEIYRIRRGFTAAAQYK